MTYLYIPFDDSEYGPIWEESEARDNFTTEELANEEIEYASLYARRDGHWGHYLSALYLEEVADILDSEYPRDSRGEEVAARILDYKLTAAIYHAHNGTTYSSPILGCRFAMIHSTLSSSPFPRALAWIYEGRDAYPRLLAWIYAGRDAYLWSIYVALEEEIPEGRPRVFLNYPDRAYEQCPYCAWIHETVDTGEREIWELGYVTTWNDGFDIYKIAEDGGEGEETPR